MDAVAGIIAAMTQALAPSPEVGLVPAPPDARPLSRRGLERLDLMLLCMEALDLNGGEAMVWLSEQMGYHQLFPNRVELWKIRSHNPLRRACRRGSLAPAETDALMQILCTMADRLYPMLRTLLSSAEPAELSSQRWELFRDRLGQLLRERMNPRRSGVQTLLDPELGPPHLRHFVQSLTLAAGPGGYERLRASLMDAVG
jgi:hypothetical protein